MIETCMTNEALKIFILKTLIVLASIIILNLWFLSYSIGKINEKIKKSKNDRYR